MFYETEQTQQTHQSITHTATVLVIDDEKAVRRYLKTALSIHGYDVQEAATGQDGIYQIVRLQPDVILLDIDLPDINGLEIIRMVREWSKIPILMLSVHNHDTAKIAALDAGADDYIIKPFSIGELMARMRVALRHVQSINSSSVFAIGDLQVDLAARSVKVGNQMVSLTPTEYGLLRFLIKHAGKVITHKQLWQAIRGEDEEVESHLIRVHMSNLRRKLEADPTNPRYIVTESGVGYRLQPDL